MRSPVIRRRCPRVLVFVVCLGLLMSGALLARLPARVLLAWDAPGAAPARQPSAPFQNRLYVPETQVELLARSPLPTPVPTPERLIVPPPSPNSQDPGWESRIEIVWPHDGAELREARLANVTAYLTVPGTNASPPCAAQPVVRLWRALNTEPAHPVAVGQKRLVTLGGHTFPIWDFNDLDVSALNDPANRLLFFVTVDGVPTRHDVWIHGSDARTVFPQTDIPPGLTREVPRAVDARIEVLWLHDDRPLEQASLANVTAYLFDAGTGKAFAPDVPWLPHVRLHWSLNNDADRGTASSRIGTPRTVAGPNGMRFLAWDFNDVDVSPARDPRNKLHYWVAVDDVPTFSNIWTHGASAPTIHPQAEVLDACQ